MRVPPGEEKNIKKPYNQTDIEALDKFKRILFSREALFQDFAWEFNYDNFYKSIRTVVNGLRNGKLVDIGAETKPLSMFSNSLWKKKLTKVSRLLEQVARTYKRGLQDKRFEFEENGRVNIHDKAIINEINHTRYEALVIINEILDTKINEITNSKQNTTKPEYLSRKETKELLNVSYVTLNNWRKKEILEPKYIGNKLFYNRQEIDNLLSSNN